MSKIINRNCMICFMMSSRPKIKHMCTVNWSILSFSSLIYEQ
jgi:hypothetical protein